MTSQRRSGEKKTDDLVLMASNFDRVVINSFYRFSGNILADDSINASVLESEDP